MKMYRAVNAVLIGVACILVTASAKSESVKDRLTRDLLKGYNSGVDPGNITLELAISATCFKFDKLTGIATTNVWEFHSWTDSRLKWNPTEYSGIDTLRLPSKLVWTPDTRLYNSLTEFTGRDSNVNTVVKSDGSVLWVAPAIHRVHCKGTDDEANCKTRFGSWTYDGYNVELKVHGSDGLDLSNYDDACPSVISSHSAEVVSHKYPCCEEPYPSLDITFTIKPRSE